jgi:putative flippase GtrA
VGTIARSIITNERLLKYGKFGLVGLLCLFLQDLFLEAILSQYVLEVNLANMAAFLLSAQCNFLLCRHFTWGGRKNTLDQEKGFGKQWFDFNWTRGISYLFALLAFGMLTITQSAIHLPNPVLTRSLAVAASSMASLILSYATSEFLVFSNSPQGGTDMVWLDRWFRWIPAFRKSSFTYLPETVSELTHEDELAPVIFD